MTDMLLRGCLVLLLVVTVLAVLVGGWMLSLLSPAVRDIIDAVR